MDFKEILKARRAELGLTMDEVGKYVGVSGATVSRWENGDIENMRRDKIAKLAEVLQVSPAYLMGWEHSNGSVDIGLSAIDIAKIAHVDTEVAVQAIENVKPRAADGKWLNLVFEEIDSLQGDSRKKLNLLARHLELIPEDTRARLLDNFSDTIDTYLDAMGIERDGE